MPDKPPSKAELRTSLRQRRQSLNVKQQQIAATSLVASVSKLPAWEKAERIALYMAADGEIDTGPLQLKSALLGKQVFLPVITDNNALIFRAWQADDPLSSNRHNIPEPLEQAPRCPTDELDIVFIPLVGWDQRGVRLGMGGGFYDRTLTGVDGPLLVGLAHANQQVKEIPRDRWDISLHFIATDTALHQCKNAPGR